MTEWTRLISYFLYDLFSAILKKNTIKTPEVIFHIRLPMLRLSSSVILKKYLYASFFSVIENVAIISFLLFSPTHTQFYSQLNRAIEPRKKFHYARPLQENTGNTRSAANQSTHIIIRVNLGSTSKITKWAKKIQSTIDCKWNSLQNWNIAKPVKKGSHACVGKQTNVHGHSSND